MQIYPNFHLVRLLLALEVVVSHASPHVLYKAWDGWIMAVPAFLGVSGFLVLHSRLHTSSDLVFLKKRVLRIVPALVLALMLGWALNGGNYMLHSTLVWLTGGLVLLGLANVPLWSLLWEEMAYLGVLLLGKAKGRRGRVVLGLLGVSLVLATVVGQQVKNEHLKVIAMLPASFLIGNAMVLYRTQWTRWTGSSEWAPWLGFALLVIVTIALDQWQPGVKVPFWIQVLVVVWLGVQGRSFLQPRMPDISYSLYVFHMPLLDWTVASGLHAHQGGMAVYAISLLLLCLVSWFFVERPVLRLKQRL